MRTRPHVCLFVAALAFATGLVLQSLAALLTEASPMPDHETATAGSEVRLVGAFYDAVDAAFGSGQTADLDPLLAPGFVEHGGPPDLPPTGAGLRQHLHALAATYPTLRLRERDAFARGDLVVARVVVAGAERGGFLGLLADLPPPWGAVDVFRIADGAIAEHWGGDAAAPGLDPFGQWPFDVTSVALLTPALTRTRLDAGPSFGLGTDLGPEAVFAEAGRLAVAVASAADPVRLWRATDAGAPPTSLAPGMAAVLTPGDLLLVPQGARATAIADGGAPATFLGVGLRQPAGETRLSPAALTPPAVPGPNATPGVAIADLAGTLSVAVPSGPARLGLGRATLVPGAALPIRAPGIAVLEVEAGALGLTDTAGVVWTRSAADGAVTTATDGTRTTGDAIVVEPGATTELHNAGDGPLVLLVATITPAS
ncbi:MAG TPA: ester cyclase [Thermomicrobiales bacterium]|jgi:hypothetical protein